MSGDSKIVLVRHPEICPSWIGRCYGHSDVPLSTAARARLGALVASLPAERPDRIIHSGWARAREPADKIADHWMMVAIADGRFAELNFGAWEGRPWHDIYGEVGDGMAQLIHEPACFAPPGGETVFALRDRVLAGLQDLAGRGLSIVVCHGGPIGAVCGVLADKPTSDWPALVPAYGQAVVLTARDVASLNSRL